MLPKIIDLILDAIKAHDGPCSVSPMLLSIEWGLATRIPEKGFSNQIPADVSEGCLDLFCQKSSTTFGCEKEGIVGL
jgi:hypothetical protein